MFCFSRANHARSNLKKVLSWKPRQVYFIHPFPRRLKLGKSLETCCVNFCFTWADILSDKETVFWKASFLQNKDCFVYETSRLVRICLLISALNKRVFLFFSGKLFYKSNRKLFSCVCISWYTHSRVLENSQQLCKPETKSRVCITVSISPNPSCVYIRLCKHGKRFLLLNCIPRTLVLEQTLSGNS